ncbi:bifunctional helix-turn-helix transcriptional regulator/GNAT family N-acetyltransferase [Variovorax sp. J22P168]|uniref:bifunctional helix-turn-helix transcriptional regulator/GNAT family N-acetyltransferase n=1 Tax=Variovorax jilinensis TaxID=3053513 RepID=UPI002575DA95|nr:bifunctional helix-turn-helix transcriptional regulator/GNAT family N-acetyltransferase [Variovorax sp. J22P168]MDM0013589.1 bifunctional helix-turn-helix transcriptional regulator/GNAT family N-acetyltransferase [Variovorax sp. J22P168]
MSALSTLPDVAAVKAIRGFNRFYTRRIGALDPYLDSDMSLTDVRVLYELAHRQRAIASEIGRDLQLDAGYLSRILRRFEAKGWLVRETDDRDARQSLLRLTDAGHAAFAPLQQKSRDEAAALLAPLAAPQRRQLVEAMGTVRALLDPESPAAQAGPRTQAAVLRDPAPGDIGWVVQQHGEIYAREYGWNSDFEALVADIAGQFLRKFQPDWERCWIAELNGERVGAVFVVRKSATTAQLRMLILAPGARGLGLGSRLTDECLAFARARGYRKMVLWTNSCLTAARGIYAARGFRLVKSEPYEGFGQQLVGETWELKL